ncbi:MAG: hypothetical protein LIO70_04510, partial [Clostridiales bacterium]|nr:hypothetical protein [Clostridiales bacterium]
ASPRILNQQPQDCGRGEAVFLRRCKKWGQCLVGLGVGVLLAMVLPVGVIIFCTGVALIALGVTWMKGP